MSVGFVEQPAIWFRFCGSRDGYESRICAALKGCGLRLQPFERAGECNGVLGFESINDEAFAILHSLRMTGRSRVIVVSVKQVDSSLTWRLLHAGASEVLAWDDEEQVSLQIRRKLERWSTVDRLAGDLIHAHGVVGESSVWRNLIKSVVEAARFSDSPILLTGESGTGKELLARAVHAVSRESDRPSARGELVTVDCGAIVPELSGSEFFGHERGAFTGALTQRDGAFALAHGGTLLLDEIGELPLSLQPQLLRAIQEKTYKRVGGNAWQTTNFRLVCATNRDLEELVRRGSFRLDLFHRIAGIVFRTPPLRERKDDILPLATYFLSHHLGEEAPGLEPCVRDLLLSRSYAGNVRELRQLMVRIGSRHVGPGPITAGDIPEEDRPENVALGRLGWPDESLTTSIAGAIAAGASLREISQTTAETAIRIAVQSEKGNLGRAARRLGVTDRALQLRRAAGKPLGSLIV